ncbi:MAG: hypothetical protein Tp1111DCM1126091_41 [Prokaryotic dsDNA virus sp.]|nr:MAG: hypothetical protein Tp1111DCM1126091_41 [Prokaryotic dsDNA virus sp.]
MKLKNYLMSLQESNKQPEQSQTHNHFKSSAELRKWYLGQHKQEFYRKLKEHR